MFEGRRKPELTEAQKTLAKKREELARVSNGCERRGYVRAWRALRSILEQEIAELEQV